MGIEVIREEMADLVDPAAEPELVADGFQFTEGPVWTPAQVVVFFTYSGKSHFKWSPEGGVVAYRQPSYHSNGLTLDGQGRLLSCEHSGRRVSIEADGELKTVVDSYQGKKLNSPNDLIVCQNGDIIFTDPPYGLSGRHGVPGEQELPFLGVYRLPQGESETVLLIDDLNAQWIGDTADEKTLYVDDTHRGHIRAFDVQEDGLSQMAKYWLNKGDEDGAPDDEAGSQWEYLLHGTGCCVGV